MTFSLQTKSPVNMTAWDYTLPDGNLITQITVGTATAHLTEDQRLAFASYLGRGVVVPQAVYEALKEDQRWRGAMESYGVDNWAGYEDAMADLYPEDDDD